MEFNANELRPSVPPGRHVLRVFDTHERESLNDNPIVEVKLEVPDGDFAGEIVRDHFVIGGPNQEAARVGRRRLVRLCRICEIPLAPGVPVDLGALIGSYLIAEVVEDTYNGLPISRVRSYHRVTPKDGLPF